MIYWTGQLADLSQILPEHFCDTMDGKPRGGAEVGSNAGCGKERNRGRHARGVFFFFLIEV